MMTYQQKKKMSLLTEGGIRERMTAARLCYRTDQREHPDRAALFHAGTDPEGKR